MESALYGIYTLGQQLVHTFHFPSIVHAALKKIYEKQYQRKLRKIQRDPSAIYV